MRDMMVKLKFYNFNEKTFELFNIPDLPLSSMTKIAREIVQVNPRMHLAVYTQVGEKFVRSFGAHSTSTEQPWPTREIPWPEPNPSQLKKKRLK